MKNIKFLTIILGLALFMVSCDKYDDYSASESPVVGFTKDQNINNIPSGEEKSAEITVFASTVSSSERTFNIIVVPIEDVEAFPPTAAENYRFDSSVTIPANEREGVMMVTGINVSLTSDRTFFKLALEDDPNVVAGGQVIIGLKGR